MRKVLFLSVLSLLLALTSSSASRADWAHSAASRFQADKGNQRHPASITQYHLVTGDTDKKAYVCSAYRNTMKEAEKGSVKTRVQVFRGNKRIDVLHMNGGVSENSVFACRRSVRLKDEDLVIFEFTFNNMPRLASNSSRIDEFTALGIVVSGEKPEAPDCTTGAPPTGGGGGGTLSAEDQDALAEGKIKKKVAFRFESDGVYIDHRYGTPHDFGPYQTIAGAWAAFEAVYGDTGGGGTLSAKDQAAVVSARARTRVAIRFEYNGVFLDHRYGAGVPFGPYATIAQAWEAFDAQY